MRFYAEFNQLSVYVIRIANVVVIFTLNARIKAVLFSCLALPYMKSYFHNLGHIQNEILFIISKLIMNANSRCSTAKLLMVM